MPKNKSSLLKPLSGKGLKKELRAVRRLAIGPQQRILRGEQRASREQSRRIGGYFDDYGNTLEKAKTDTASAYGTANARIGADTEKAANYAETLRQRMQGEERADAATRGVAYDASGSHTSADANLARVNAANVLSGVTSAQGANQGAYLSDKKRIGDREEIEQKLREAARRRSIKSEKKDLAREGRDVVLSERGRLRDSERDYHLGLLAAGNTKAGQQISAQNSKRSARASRANSRRTAANNKRSTNASIANSKRTNKPDKGESNSGGGKAKGGKKKEGLQAKAYLKTASPGKIATPGDARAYLINRGISPSTARHTVRAAKKGGKGGKKKRGGNVVGHLPWPF